MSVGGGRELRCQVRWSATVALKPSITTDACEPKVAKFEVKLVAFGVFRVDIVREQDVGRLDIAVRNV